MTKPISEWAVSDFAKHYCEVMQAPPNGWGQHVSDHFGQSHDIAIAAHRATGLSLDEVWKEFEKELTNEQL